MAFWRPWEVAFLRKHAVFNEGLTLDLACGDGKFAEIMFAGQGLTLIGSDLDPEVAAQAGRKKIYQEVVCADAARLPFTANSFANVFSNCAFEHFDELGPAIDEVRRVLKPGGSLIFTAVTDKFRQWQLLPDKQWRQMQNLKNCLPAASWIELLQKKHLQVELAEEYLSWLPTNVFLLLDQLWHAFWGKRYLRNHLNDQKLPRRFRLLFQLLARISVNAEKGSGIILIARKEE